MKRDVGETIKAFCNCLEREANKMEHQLLAGDVDITRGQGAVIGYIYRETNDGKNVYQKDVEKIFCIRRSSATNILNRLESKGYIVREKDENDARAKKLSLTPKGLGFVDVIKENIARLERKVVEGITEEEIDAFYSVIEKMTENLNENK